MTSDPNFKFDITVSEKSYKSKPTSADYCQMKWHQKKTSLRNFISMVMAGYSYCHIYVKNMRRKDKFLYTQVISIDVDNTDAELKDFYSRCQLKPTFAYETFSNAFSKPIGPDAKTTAITSPCLIPNDCGRRLFQGR